MSPTPGVFPEPSAASLVSAQSTLGWDLLSFLIRPNDRRLPRAQSGAGHRAANRQPEGHCGRRAARRGPAWGRNPSRGQEAWVRRAGRQRRNEATAGSGSHVSSALRVYSHHARPQSSPASLLLKQQTPISPRSSSLHPHVLLAQTPKTTRA